MGTIATTMGNGSDILGYMLAWELNGIKATYHTLVHAYRDADLDDRVVRTKLPRHAFTQAARKLSDERVIDKLDEDETDIRFQFTRRFSVNGVAEKEFEYIKEAVLVLSKSTGRVFCADDPDLAIEAERLVSEYLDTYTGANIAIQLKTLFKENADIFSFPRDGGVYLVPSAHEEFISKIRKFVESINGRLSQLPIARGTEQGDRAFRETISASIEKTIETHLKAIEALSSDNQNRTFESRAREIQETRYKVECYASYLGSEAQRLLQIVEDAKVALRNKIMEASVSVFVG